MVRGITEVNLLFVPVFEDFANPRRVGFVVEYQVEYTCTDIAEYVCEIDYQLTSTHLEDAVQFMNEYLNSGGARGDVVV